MKCSALVIRCVIGIMADGGLSYDTQRSYNGDVTNTKTDTLVHTSQCAHITGEAATDPGVNQYGTKTPHANCH